MFGRRRQLVVDYDEENKSFFISDPNLTYWSSIPFGNIIIDIDKKGRIKGIEVLNCQNIEIDLKAHEKIIKELEKCERKK